MSDHSPCINQEHRRPPGCPAGSGTTLTEDRGPGWLALALLTTPWLVTVACWRQLMLRQPLAGLTLLPGLAVAILILLHLSRHRCRNHRPGEGERPFATLGAANWVTLLRGSATIALAGFLPLSLPSTGGLRGSLAWVPGLLYLGMALADLLDGLVARRSGRVTELGKTLDTSADAAGLLIASLLAVTLGRLPAATLLAGFAYYPFTLGLWFRKRQCLPITPLRPRPYSRIIAGYQMALVGVALLPLVAPRYLAIASYLFMTPLLLGFLRDWLVVSGRLATDAGQQTVWDRWAATLWCRLLPPLLRLFLLGALLSGSSSPAGLAPADPWRLAVVVCALLVVCGLLGRLSALALAVLLALSLSPNGPDPHALFYFTAGLTLALTGTGDYSLWSPEEAILYRQQTHNPNTPPRDDDHGCTSNG